MTLCLTASRTLFGPTPSITQSCVTSTPNISQTINCRTNNFWLNVMLCWYVNGNFSFFFRYFCLFLVAIYKSKHKELMRANGQKYFFFFCSFIWLMIRAKRIELFFLHFVSDINYRQLCISCGGGGLLNGKLIKKPECKHTSDKDSWIQLCWELQEFWEIKYMRCYSEDHLMFFFFNFPIKMNSCMAWGCFIKETLLFLLLIALHC